MAKPNLDKLSAEQLLALRKQIDIALAGKRRELEKQIVRLGGSTSVKANGTRAMRVKYRDKDGHTWAGVGARPKWLVAALKKGRKLDSFLIR